MNAQFVISCLLLLTRKDMHINVGKLSEIESMLLLVYIRMDYLKNLMK